MFPLVLLLVEVQNTICNSYLYLPQAGEIWTKSDDPNYIEYGAFWQKKEKKTVYHVTIYDISLVPFWKRFLHVEQLMMLKYVS